MKLRVPIDDACTSSTVCFLFLEGWSSWFYILHFLGFQFVYVIDHINPISYSMLRTHYTFHIWNISKFTTWLTSNPASSALIFLEGSHSALTKWWEQLRSFDGFSRFNLCAIATTRLRSFRFMPGLRWHRLHHHNDCGGVSTFAYQIGVSPSLSWQPLPYDNTSWELQDILEVAHGGVPCAPPEHSPYLLVSRFLSRAPCPLSYRRRAYSTHMVGSNATCFHRSFCEPTTFLKCLMLIF